MAEQTKLNWIQRISAKRLLKQYINKAESYRKENNNKLEEAERKKIYLALAEIQELIYITSDEGKELTKNDFKVMNTKELIKLFEDSLKEVGKMI